MIPISMRKASANCYGKIALMNIGVPITLVLDNARYQKCKIVAALASKLDIELLFLPGQSHQVWLILAGTDASALFLLLGDSKSNFVR
jgi:hypothetical protein